MTMAKFIIKKSVCRYDIVPNFYHQWCFKKYIKDRLCRLSFLHRNIILQFFLKYASLQQKRMKSALYQEPFIVPQNSGTDQFSGLQVIHAPWPSLALPSSLKSPPWSTVTVSLLSFSLSLCLSFTLSPTHTHLPDSLSLLFLLPSQSVLF